MTLKVSHGFSSLDLEYILYPKGLMELRFRDVLIHQADYKKKKKNVLIQKYMCIKENELMR